MRVALRISLLAIGLASWLGAGGAGAGALVEFPNVSERGPATLVGYLARPDQGLSALLGGAGHSLERFPAVVVLHGCSGISSHSAGIADRLGSEGYVALAVDSLEPRGIASRCGDGGSPEQAFDAYAARRYLAQQGFVDTARIAVLGQSMGGNAALYAVDRDMAAQYFTERFRAAIAYYPACVLPLVTLTAPTLILAGERDDWTPAERCREMVAHARPDSASIALHVYPGAHHAFDVAGLQPGRRAFGHWLEYNEAAAKDAEEKVRAFLAAHLAETSPGEPTAK
jgi:dienelactone hydrolase